MLRTQGGVRSLSYTEDGKLISGAEDKLIKVWDKNWNCVLTIDGHDDYIRVVKGLSNNRVASGSRDNSLKVWSLETKKLLQQYKGHGLPVWSILEIQSNKILGTGSSGNRPPLLALLGGLP